MRCPSMRLPPFTEWQLPQGQVPPLVSCRALDNKQGPEQHLDETAIGGGGDDPVRSPTSVEQVPSTSWGWGQNRQGWPSSQSQPQQSRLFPGLRLHLPPGTILPLLSLPTPSHLPNQVPSVSLLLNTEVFLEKHQVLDLKILEFCCHSGWQDTKKNLQDGAKRAQAFISHHGLQRSMARDEDRLGVSGDPLTNSEIIHLMDIY